MKKRIFLFLAAFLGLCYILKAQEEAALNLDGQPTEEEAAPLYRSIYAEFFGASNLIGISYDCRIKPGSPFGYRAGISYMAGSSYNLYGSDHMEGFAVPLEFNCILGKRKSKFEVSFGTSLGVYCGETSSFLDADGNPTILFPTYVIRENKTAFGYYFYSNIGYRYQRKNGFMLRVGVSPSFSFGGKHGIRKSPLLYPYLSLGYTIGNK